MQALSDEKIINSWMKNVDPWINALAQNEIESRANATNNAILTEITKRSPAKVLDIGCGEGWLVDSLSKLSIDTFGIDAVPAFIKYAKNNKKGRYKILKYEDINNKNLHEKFDIIVCNFSLLGKSSVEHVFKNIPNLLNKEGSFIIQTIHPFTSSKSGYNDGWRKGNWNGFNINFSDPAPWYFRTLMSWCNLFEQNQLYITSILEPMIERKLASIIFIGKQSL